MSKETDTSEYVKQCNTLQERQTDIKQVDDLIYKDLQQLENILSNYKFYIMNNNFDAIELCLKYILESNFFFNKVVTNRIEKI